LCAAAQAKDERRLTRTEPAVEEAPGTCPFGSGLEVVPGIKEAHMADVEQIEVARYRNELRGDLNGLVDRYLRILEWDVPEADEKKARRLIVEQIKQAAADLENGLA
jgi:hypothetical protein